MGNFRDNDRGFGRDRPRSSFGGRSNFRDGGSRGFGRDKPRAEMHDATCDKCKKECQVPFRPSGDKPVLCSDCFRSQGNTHEGFGNSRGPSMGGSSSGISSEQFKELNTKVDKILEILESIEFEDEGEEEAEEEVEEKQ